MGPRLFFCAFSKKTQGPFWGKKLNLSEAISDFSKNKLKKFHTQITVFHGVTPFRSFSLTNF